MRAIGAILLLLGLLPPGQAVARAAEPSEPATWGLLRTEASVRAEDLLAKGGEAGFGSFGQPTPNLGFLRPDEAAWVRIDLPGDPAREVTRVIELGITRLRRVDWHVTSNGRVLEVVRSGADNAADLSAQRMPWVSVDIPRGESRTVLLRVASDTALWLPLRVGTPSEHAARNLARAQVDFAVFGFCLGIALLNLLLGGITRNTVYLVAGALPLAHVLYQAVFLGYHQAAFPGLPRWFSREGMLLLAVALGVGLFAFTHRMLGQGTSGRLTRAAIACGLASAPVVLLTPFSTGSQLANLLLVAGGGLCVWASAAGARQGPRTEGWLLLAGWVLPLASGVVLLLQLGGHTPAWFNPTAVIRIILPGTFILFALAVVQSQRRLREAEEGLGRSRRRQEEARLAALRHQLNPHLAFNTLASIEALSREAPERIPGLVSRLAAFLRHRMAPSGHPFQTLGQELEAARAYLDIEATHLGERLQVRYAVGEDCAGFQVPEFTLQPLVENAVKHGLAESDRVTLRIEASAEGGRLRLRVANTGRIRPRPSHLRGEGIGLENLRQRLALHLGERARAGLRETEGWVIAEVELPALRDIPLP